MKNAVSREKLLNNYILSVQLLFNFLALIVVFKFCKFSLFAFQPLELSVFVVFLALILVSIIYVSKHNQNKYYDYSMISIDVLLINLLMHVTNLYELRFLYIIPVIITAIKYRMIFSIGLAVLVNGVNIVYDSHNLNLLKMGYTVETDLILMGIFVILTWLIGSLVKVERGIRNDLYLSNESLLRNQAILEKIVNEMPLCLIVIDSCEQIVLINKPALNYADLNELVPESFIGKKYIEYYNLAFRGRSLEDSFIIKSLKEHKVFNKEKIIKKGQILELNTKPVFDKNGKVIFVLCIFSDITTEEQLKEKMSHLEKLNAVGQMAAGIAHEIKNPLTTIKGFLQLGLKNKDYLKEQHIELLINELERCNGIVKDFLATSRRKEDSKKSANLKDIIEYHQPLIEKDAIFNNCELKLELNNVSDLLLNADEIKQLILNLGRNAIDAMEDKGILTLKLWEESKDIILEIRDTGKGIPADVLEKIGTPFFTTKESGTGLGLSVCHHIVENHGARLEIESKVGEGTNVRVLFSK